MSTNLKLFAAALTALFALSGTVSAAPWVPIVGIPEPEFGYRVQDTAPARPDPWTSEQPGFYFVNRNTGSDTSNPYGTPAAPRLSIPQPIPAGSYVEIEGVFDRSFQTIQANGTSANPIFIRGRDAGSRPTIQGLFSIENSSYVVLEQLLFQPLPSTGGGSSGLFVATDGTSHVVVRDSEFSGVGNIQKTGGAGVGDTSGTPATQIVFDNIHFHDIGHEIANPTNIPDQDAHCIGVNGPANHVWVINSTMERCSGDGMQIEAFHNNGRDQVHHIYFGNNYSGGHVQAGVWVKHAQDVIISSNELFAGVPAADGTAQGQCGGAQYTGDNIWYINNLIHDCANGLFFGSSDDNIPSDHNPIGVQGGVFVVGNVIHTINQTIGGLSERGTINTRLSDVAVSIVGNTLLDGNQAITGTSSGVGLDIFNNIIVNSRQFDGFDIYLAGIANNTRMDFNIFDAPTGTALFSWNGDLANIASLSGAAADAFGIGIQCQNCDDVDPGFIDAGSNNYGIRGDSPARNTGMVADVYQTFFDRYGISIAQDRNGLTRPDAVSSTWDRGAFEADETLRPQVPTTVTAVPVVP